MHDGLCKSLRPFSPSARPLHKVIVLSKEKYILILVALPLLVLGEARIEGDLLFFGAGEGGVWESKEN